MRVHRMAPLTSLTSLSLAASLVLSAAVASAQNAPAASPSAGAPTPAATAPSAAAPQTLPGGASQIQEAHGDWRVACAAPNGQKVCAFSQQILDSNSRQLIVGVELKASSPDKAEGTLVLPFGLAVEKPIVLQADESGTSLVHHVRTCLPVGCLVSLNFDAAMVGVLRKASVLNIKATADGGPDTAFKISLNGFGSALDRTVALSK